MCFRLIDIAVAGLELRFQADFEMGQVDKVPAGEVPPAGICWFAELRHSNPVLLGNLDTDPTIKPRSQFLC